MKMIYSPCGIVRLSHPEQGISDLLKTGVQNVLLDFNMCCSAYEFEYLGTKNKKVLQEFPSVTEQPSGIRLFFEKMLDTCRQKGINTPIAQAPYFLRNTKRMDLTELLFQIHVECIKFCGSSGSSSVIIRPLFSGIPYGKEWEVNKAYYLRLAPIAKEHHVMILLENQCEDLGGHLIRGVCSDGPTVARWVDMLNEEVGEERFGFCMDVGVCNLCGQDMREYALALGNRIKAVILRDCDGHQESSQLPFTCVYHGQPQTDWLGLIRGLREIGFDGDLILDLADTASAFSPLLRPQLLPLAKAVAEYFRWQIGIENLLKKYKQIVLFGAGNMCRNYMKCYGEKYPPLFTCDNNQKVWGTQFCGLEVKAPDALKEIPEDCAVFICNIYYREIEHQLREMGIDNPIEFFNDEYMPSFYFDRLKGV